MTDRQPKIVKISTPAIADRGAFRIGSMAPGLPAVRTAPAAVAAGGKVRIGSMSPAL